MRKLTALFALSLALSMQAQQHVMLSLIHI